MATDVNEAVETLELDEVWLESLSAVRGDGQRDSPGKVRTEFNVGIDVESAPDISCLVTIRTTFMDGFEAEVVVVEISHGVTYVADGDADWDDKQLGAELGRTSVSHVAPFAREILADLTSKMNLPRYLMPLVRRSDLRVTKVESIETTE